MFHLVQIGVMGQVGRFWASDGIAHTRGERVIVRTGRGLEVGEVLAGEPEAVGQADGDLLRRMTPQDEMLAERLGRNRDAAYEACVRLLQEQGSTAVLLDVEHLFDGQGLYFYFLGGPDPTTEAITSELAAAYDSEARFGDFAEAVEEGCGPGCGTEEAENGCGSSGACATCAVASACGSKKRAGNEA